MVTDCIKGPCKAEPEHVHSLHILNHQISCFPGSVIYVLKWSCWGGARGDTCPGADPVRWNPAIPAFLSHPPQIFDHGTNAPSFAPWHRELCSEELPEDSQRWGNTGNIIGITALSGAACTLWETRNGLECIGVHWPRGGGNIYSRMLQENEGVGQVWVLNFRLSFLQHSPWLITYCKLTCFCNFFLFQLLSNTFSHYLFYFYLSIKCDQYIHAAFFKYCTLDI